MLKKMKKKDKMHFEENELSEIHKLNKNQQYLMHCIFINCFGRLEITQNNYLEKSNEIRCIALKCVIMFFLWLS